MGSSSQIQKLSLVLVASADQNLGKPISGNYVHKIKIYKSVYEIHTLSMTKLTESCRAASYYDLKVSELVREKWRSTNSQSDGCLLRYSKEKEFVMRQRR